MIFVLDASALIALLRDEPGADVVAKAILEAEQCFVHSLNLCEVFYDFCRASGRGVALQAIADVVDMGVIEDANISPIVWQAAGTLKANLHRVS